MTTPPEPYDFAPGHFRPRPGRAPLPRMVRAATGQELRVTVRNAEQLLLAFVIPLAALLVMTVVHVGDLPEPRIATVTPGILGLAIVSASFTSQAILTGFDRRYGVLKRLAATGFPRWLLLASKCAATTALVAAQFVVIAVVAVVALDWHPRGSALWLVPIAILGVAAHLGLALLLGGTMRAEAVLGVANLAWFVLIGIGGVVIPLTDAPNWLQTVGAATPTGALTNMLRSVLTDGHAPGLAAMAVLIGWVLVGWAATVRWFRWHS